MKKVLIFGTFDGVHDGHRNLFLQAREHGDHLSAVVARDETVEKIKGRPPQYDEQKRLADLAREKNIDLAILGSKSDKYKVVREQGPNVICLGYDQKNFITDLRKELDKSTMQETKVIRLRAHKPEIYKSSIINDMKNNKVTA